MILSYNNSGESESTSSVDAPMRRKSYYFNILILCKILSRPEVLPQSGGEKFKSLCESASNLVLKIRLEGEGEAHRLSLLEGAGPFSCYEDRPKGPDKT